MYPPLGRWTRLMCEGGDPVHPPLNDMARIAFLREQAESERVARSIRRASRPRPLRTAVGRAAIAFGTRLTGERTSTGRGPAPVHDLRSRTATRGAPRLGGLSMPATGAGAWECRPGPP